MSKHKKNKDKLAIQMLTKINLDYERPIFLEGIVTNYTVTIDGDIISYKGYNTDKPKILKQMTVNGYKKVNLTINGREKLYSVHRLVANAFIENPYNKPEVNHKDGNKTKNNSYNLEWSTEKENIQHAFRTGLKHGNRGASHPLSKITEEMAIRICELLENDLSYQEICNITHISYNIIKKINNGYRWKHVSKNFNLKYNKKE